MAALYKTVQCDVLPGARPSASRFTATRLEGSWKGRITDIKVSTRTKGSFVLHVGAPLRQRITLSVEKGGETILHIADNDTWAPVSAGWLYEVEHVLENDDAGVLSLSFMMVLSRGREDSGPIDLSPLLA